AKYQSNSFGTVSFASLFLVADKDTNIGVAIEMIYVVKTYASYQHIIVKKYYSKTMHIFGWFIKPIQITFRLNYQRILTEIHCEHFIFIYPF
ncbi:MAG TPA: hypothetical protein VJZ05_00390, partial [Bacilli bacterium]|nr:hypothetical protein [Bacilli bacterium]